MGVTHKCPGPSCRQRVPLQRLACHRHWWQVPKPIRDRVYATYRAGAGSPEHVNACAEAIATMTAIV